MKILFVRHLPTVRRTDDLAANWRLDGTRTARELDLIHRLKNICLDLIVTSQERKSIDTAQRVFFQAQPHRSDPRLNELSRGAFIQDYETHVQSVFDHPHESIGGWEPASDCLHRILDLIGELNTSESRSVGFVGHGLQSALLRAYVLDQPKARLHDWQRIEMPDLIELTVDPDLQIEVTRDFTGLTASTAR